MHLRYSLHTAGTALVAVLMCSGCTQRLYFPDRANTPGLGEALEGKITASWKAQGTARDSNRTTTLGRGTSFALDAAFAPIKHLGLTASYRALNDRVTKDERVFLSNNDIAIRDAVYQGDRWDGAVGYFSTFGDMGCYEIYLGGGAGELRRHGFGEAQYDYTMRYVRYYAQPAVGIGHQAIVVMGGLRILAQHYTFFSAPDPQRAQYIAYAPGERSLAGRSIVCMEPFINCEVGYCFLKLNAQIGSSVKLAGQRVTGSFPVYGCAGITVHYAPSFLTRFGGRRAHKKTVF